MKQSIFFAIALVLACCVQARAGQSDQVRAQGTLSAMINGGWHVSPPLTVEAIEAKEQEKSEAFHKQHPDRNDVPMVPFGFQNPKWKHFKAAVKPSDEIRFVSSPPKYWRHLSGREGYVLVRHGRIIRFLVTREN